MRETRHATAIAQSGAAVVIIGPSGAGKSDLALRCIALAPNAIVQTPFALIADDRVEVEVAGDALIARYPTGAPADLEGCIEVRGVGIVRVPHVNAAPVRLVVDLAPAANMQRLPDPWPTREICGITIPCLVMSAEHASAPLKIALALDRLARKNPRQSHP